MTFTVCRRKLIAYALMGAGAIFYVGWLSGIAYFNVSERWRNERSLVVMQTQTVPGLKAKAKAAIAACNGNADLAVQGIYGSNSAPADLSLDDLKDCPRVK